MTIAMPARSSPAPGVSGGCISLATVCLAGLGVLSAATALATAADGISVTENGRILVELGPEDTAPANPFDLNGRTLVFMPDGQDGYTREVQSLAWEEDAGEAVGDGAVVELESFGFDFAGERWYSFHVSRHGLVTFGGPLAYSYWDANNRFDTMREIADGFVAAPTISALYKPMLGGRTDRYGATQHVATSPERVVITWRTTEPDFYVQGVAPDEPASFQAVLSADGSVRLSYSGVSLGDGIVGLFPDDDVVKAELIASVADATDPELAGHLDLLETAVHATNREAVIVEIRTRDAHSAGQFYRLHFDVDEPYWSDYDRADLDFTWGLDIDAHGEYHAWHTGDHDVQLLAADDDRVSLLVRVNDPEGVSASVVAGVGLVDDDWRMSDTSPATRVEIPQGSVPVVDLSVPDSQFSAHQHEVFHYRSAPDPAAIACRVIEALGDEFDLFVFHNEFRVDSQESASPWTRYGHNVGVSGVGDVGGRTAPCGEGRLKGHWSLPVWMDSDHVFQASLPENERFDRGLLLFAHEFTHAWTARASYDRNGEREPLFGNYCRCHWRWELHAPAAFPWHADEDRPAVADGRQILARQRERHLHAAGRLLGRWAFLARLVRDGLGGGR